MCVNKELFNFYSASSDITSGEPSDNFQYSAKLKDCGTDSYVTFL